MIAVVVMMEAVAIWRHSRNNDAISGGSNCNSGSSIGLGMVAVVIVMVVMILVMAAVGTVMVSMAIVALEVIRQSHILSFSWRRHAINRLWK